MVGSTILLSNGRATDCPKQGGAKGKDERRMKEIGEERCEEKERRPKRKRGGERKYEKEREKIRAMWNCFSGDLVNHIESRQTDEM